MRALGVLLGCVLVASCGGGGGGGNPAPPAPPPMFTIGGTVTGLAGSGLELRNNAGNPLAVTASGGAHVQQHHRERPRIRRYRLAPAVDPTGRFLALTNLGSANITVFRIDPAQGSLAHVPGSPYAPSVGATPGLVTFDPSARFAYLTDASTSSISSYEIDVDTGHPTFVGSQPTGGAPGGVMAILGRQ